MGLLLHVYVYEAEKESKQETAYVSEFRRHLASNSWRGEGFKIIALFSAFLVSSLDCFLFNTLIPVKKKKKILSWIVLSVHSVSR